ncbi:hypothetical protein CAPTEDRAFT_178211 [Capitella teleta]|uniref:Rab-GAP TBC domain-containing protein n=1 Tax=Capitella teleta TaxID=283909 RepID=R7U513_CAPTE|nr:hypothetical protein CAPTEDRAFT_178211 [Capitella teleta]|eukprot:ELU01425.1 hypothetical protein CAPTEDRAFT_178211 [Capitella teleta]
MAAFYGVNNKEVVRIKVKKCDGMIQPEYKKLCVDPQITSFDMLQRLLAKAFNIQQDFTISYLARDDFGREVYLSLLSDWDIDAAFLSAHMEPYLRLKVDLKPFEDTLEDWDVVPTEEYNSQTTGTKSLSSTFLDKSLLGSITGTISSQVGKTMSQVSKAIEDNRYGNATKTMMTDAEFHNFLDSVGHLVQPQQFRLSVYQGGIEPSLRKVAWRHLLNVYPEGFSGKERFEYLKRKVNEYRRICDEWRDLYANGEFAEEIKVVINMVKKDVLRTDRLHPYFEGSDDNQNVISLFNLLVTYALTHPEVSYCQGMSDIASPILVVQNDEAHAYVCFCGIMRRLRGNFSCDGVAMTTKFQHLSLFLQHQDPVFHAYMKEHQADDLFFCYRWLLLEMKREFPLDNAMYMLEVMWSSIAPDPPQDELPLVDPIYAECGMKALSMASPSPTTSVYIQLLSQRRRRSAPSSAKPVATPCDDMKTLNPDDFVEIRDDSTAVLQEKSVIIDRSLECSIEDKTNDIAQPLADLQINESSAEIETSHAQRPSLIPVQRVYDCDSSATSPPSGLNSCEEATESPPSSIEFVKVTEKPALLPPPSEFGARNPFLICLSLALLLLHRDHIIHNHMDYNELAMHFDKMVRKQNVYRVVQQAQSLYGGYLKYQQGLLDRQGGGGKV